MIDDEFFLQVKKKINKELNKIDQIQDIINTINCLEQGQVSTFIRPNMGEIISLEKIRRRMQDFKKNLGNLRKSLNGQSKFGHYYDELLQIQQEDNIFRQCIIGLDWSHLPPQQLNIIIKQINQQEQDIIKKIKIYSKIFQDQENKQRLLQLEISAFQAYFVSEFSKNQTIKLIFNSIMPFIDVIPCTSKPDLLHQFAFILHKFKNNAEQSFKDMKNNLQMLFPQKIDRWNIVDEASQMSSISINTNDFFQEIVKIQDTKSQDDDYYQPESKIADIPNCPRKHRKYSDSNIKNVKIEQNGVFLKKIFEQKPKKNLLKLAIVSFKQQQQEQMVENSQLLIQQQDKKNEQNNSQVDNFKKYSFKYSYDKIKFLDGQLYFGFKRLLFISTFKIIKYLSSNNIKNKNISHIAKHYLEGSWTDNLKEFKVEVQKGDDMKYPQPTNGLDKTLKWLWYSGIKYVYQWIIDIAIGVSELEELGIYHADLNFRNTIRVSKRGWFAFKIIDFDMAFKVINFQEYDEAYKCTSDLIDHWLRFRYDTIQPRAPFDEVSMSHFQSSQGASNKQPIDYNYKQTDIIKYLFFDADQRKIDQLIKIKNAAKFSSRRVFQCFQMLHQHMLLSHLNQYTKLVRQLLAKDIIEQQCNQQQIKVIKKIEHQLQKLANKVIDYRQFAYNVAENINIKNNN